MIIRIDQNIVYVEQAHPNTAAVPNGPSLTATHSNTIALLPILIGPRGIYEPRVKVSRLHCPRIVEASDPIACAFLALDNF